MRNEINSVVVLYNICKLIDTFTLLQTHHTGCNTIKPSLNTAIGCNYMTRDKLQQCFCSDLLIILRADRRQKAATVLHFFS